MRSHVLWNFQRLQHVHSQAVAVTHYPWTRYPLTFSLGTYRSNGFWDPRTNHPCPMYPDPGSQQLLTVTLGYFRWSFAHLSRTRYIQTRPNITSGSGTGTGHIVQGRIVRETNIHGIGNTTMFRETLVRETSRHRAGVLDEPYSQLSPPSGVAIQARQYT